MSSSAIVTKREGSVITITLNRPEKLNSLNKEIFDQLKSLVDILESDRSLRAVILTGAGEKAFCAGADLKERQGMSDKEILSRFEFIRQLYLRLERLPCVVIAAINGTALGGGLELALASDLRVVSDAASLGLPEVDLGIIPGNGGTQRLSRLAGLGRALELVLLAKRFDAKAAYEYGLVHAVVPASQVMSTAKTWAAKCAESGPLAIKQAKRAIREGIAKPLEEALAWETECYRQLLTTKDRAEGIKAFLEKRKPVYRGE